MTLSLHPRRRLLMMRRSLVLLPIFLVVSWCRVCAFQTNCDKGETGCSSESEHVIEQPNGVIDGKNIDFTLSRPPATPGSVRLFLNDLELIRGIDFSIIDRYLTVLRPHALQPGVRLRVSYDALVSRALSASSQPAMEAERRQNLIRESLLEAVAGELPAKASQQGPMSERSAEAGQPWVNAVPRSLSMLSQRLNENRDAKNSKSENGRRSLSGFEGTASLPAESPYAALLGIKRQEATGLLGEASADRSSGGQVYRSFSLLERRLIQPASEDSEGRGVRQ